MGAGDTEDTVPDAGGAGKRGEGTATPTPSQPERTPERPLAVAGTAVLYVIGGVIAFGGAIVLIVGGTLFSAFLPIGGGLLAALGAVIGVVVMLVAFVAFAIGWAIWQGRDWGRAVAVVFSGIALLLGVLGVLGSLAAGEAGSLAGELVFAAPHAAVVYFFTRNYVEDWFHAMPG